MQKPIVKQLKNGLRVCYLPYKDVYSVTINLKGFAGSNFEKDTEIGAAHMLEHLVLKGSEQFSSENSLKSLITFFGGKIIAATSRDDVTFAVHVLSKDIENALVFLSEIFYKPALDAIHLENLKKIVVHEINRYNDMPERSLVRRSYKALFPNNRISILNTGEVNDIEKLTIEAIKNFYKRNYTNNRFCLSVCGNFEIEEIDALVTKIFSQKTDETTVEQVLLEQDTSTRTTSINQARLKTTYIKIDYYANKFGDSNKYKTEILAKYLDMALKSQVISEAGFSYKTNCESFSSHSYGIFSVFTTCVENDIPSVFALIKKELNGAKLQLDLSLLQQAKNSYFSELVFQNEKVSGRSQFYGDLLLNNCLDQTEDYILNYINNITAQELMEHAKLLLDQNPKITAITPEVSAETLKEYWLAV